MSNPFRANTSSGDRNRNESNSNHSHQRSSSNTPAVIPPPANQPTLAPPRIQAPRPAASSNSRSVQPSSSRQAPLEPTVGLSKSSPDEDKFTERLLPPRPVSAGRQYHDESPCGSPPNGLSPLMSRRSSIDSQTPLNAPGRYGRDTDPFDDSRAGSRRASISASTSDDENVNTQTVSQKYNILPSSGLLLFPEDVEKDDWLHNPIPGEKEPRQCDIFSKRGMVNIGGLIFVTLGTLLLFIGYPLATFVDNIFYPSRTACAQTPGCISAQMPLLTNVRTSLIDPDTPADVMTRTAKDGSTQYLVFSDEFNTPGRTFYKDDDPYWQGVDLWYGATFDLEWYDPDALSTGGGTLNIRFDQFKNHGLNYRSGMLQSWNKFCFKRGYVEASISLPGAGDTSGFWPGFWTMGNLGRPGYMATTEGMWPYSYHDECDYGITPNQSSPDGLSWLPGMKLPACVCDSELHPSPGKSRTAPEIDALEASVGSLNPPDGPAIGTVSQSYQLAPFDIWYQPNYEFVEVYDSRITMMNPYRGGPIQQAFSALTNLNNDWYDGNAYQSYAFEYTPGGDGYASWYVGKQRTWTLDARSMGPNGNVGQRTLPEEPMTIIANLGMAENFAPINLTGIQSLLPATMRVDYIRVYQDGDGHVGCDPPDYPTTEYIASHPRAYENPQKTSWASSGYKWPTNDFVNGC